MLPSRFNQLVLADTPNAVPWARRHVVDILRRWQVPAGHIDTAELLISELATNAVSHQSTKEQPSPFAADFKVRPVTVTLRLAGSHLLLMVHDHDVRPPVLKEVGVEAENGRGIFLVACMSAQWGHYVPTSVGGKVVWCQLDLSESGDAVPEPAPAASAPSSWRSVAAAEPPIRPAAKATTHLIAKTLVGLRAL